MEIWFEMEEIALKASLDKLGVPPLIEVHVGFPLYKVGTEPLRQNWKRGRTISVSFGIKSFLAQRRGGLVVNKNYKKFNLRRNEPTIGKSYDFTIAFLSRLSIARKIVIYFWKMNPSLN